MRLARTAFIVALLAAVIAPVALALRFTDDSYTFPVGEVGKPYSKQLNGAGGCGPGLPYQYRILNGALPSGLVLDRSGLIHGTPTAAGESSFWVELSDEDPPSASWCRPEKAQREFTIKIIQGLTVAATAAPAATVGTPYTFTLSANGGGTLTWSLAKGPLPDGLALGSNGVISGTPTKVGDFPVTVQVSDGSRTATRDLKITVYAPLAVTPPKSTSAEVELPFKTAAPIATGGLAPYKWSVSGNLPAGFAIDATTGIISGTPTAVGTFPIKLVLTDALGGTKETDLQLTVAAKLKLAAPLRIKPTEVGLDYSLTLVKTGGVEPLKWTVTGKPVGLLFDGSTGELAGRPKLRGTYHVVATAVDALGAKSTVEFDVKVAPKLTITTTRLLGTKIGKAFSRKIVTRGGAGKLSFKITGGKLPVGVRLNRATGELVGTPQKSGDFTFTVTVTDGLHATSTQKVAFRVIQ